MKKKNRSIGQLLQRASTLEGKKAVALRWAEEWNEEYHRLLQDLEEAIETGDRYLFRNALGQLKESGQRRFDALPRVLSHLADTSVLTPSTDSVD